MKKFMALVLAFCLGVSLCACGKTSTVEGKGYKTPEEALQAYAEALKTGDVDKILATYAVESHVANFDMARYIDHVGVYSAGSDYMLSPIDTFTRESGVIQRQYKIINQLSWMYLYVGFGEELDSGVINVNQNGEYTSASRFLKDLEIDDWMDILAEMEIGDVLQPEDFVDDDLIPENTWDKAEDVLKKKERYLGCDEIACLGLEIELDGEDYYLCPEFACYGGKWYVLTQAGTLAMLLGTPANTGGLVER